MKLVWIGAFVLVFMSLASLISNPQSGRLLEEGWTGAINVLPNTKLAELQRTTPTYTSRIFGLLPEPFHQKFATKTWMAVELMTFRSLVLWHMAPTLLIPFIVGFLEGSWARSNQKTLIKMHSPMRFSLALTTLMLSPIMALLWVTAPMSISATVLVLALTTIAIIGTRNLIVHAPTHF